MSPAFYYILHVLSLLVLTGGAFYGFAGAPETRKKVLMATGIASVLMLISGFGLIAKLHGNNFAQPWLYVKLVAWLGISALAGLGYRKRQQAPVFFAIILGLAALALWAVYSFRLQA